MPSISLPRLFEDQGSGYPLRVYKITLKWTGPVKILTKDQLGSHLQEMPLFCYSVYNVKTWMRLKRNCWGIQGNNYQGIPHRHKLYLYLTNIRVKKTCHGRALPDLFRQIPLVGLIFRFLRGIFSCPHKAPMFSTPQWYDLV